MDLVKILSPDAVCSIRASLSREKLLLRVGTFAAAAYGINASSATAALEQREKDVSTGLGHGVALPHARVADIDRVVGLFVRLKMPVKFKSPDRRLVDLVFALFAPEDPAVDYLKFMASIARKLRDPQMQNSLRSTYNPALLYLILTEGDTGVMAA